MQCLLRNDALCVECGECTRCDLDGNKLCDNCMACLRSDADYAAIEIDAIIEEEDG